MPAGEKPKKWYGRELRGLDIPQAKVPKVPYMVNPILIKGESLLIHGPQQCGKSTLTWNMAKAIGAGQRFLGLETEAGNVLYIDADVQLDTALPRLQTIGAMPGVTFLFVPGMNVLSPHPSLLETLRWYQQELRPAVVIFNTLRKIYSGDSIDDETPNKVMTAIRHIFPQSAIVLNHHDVKRRFSEKGTEIGAQEEAFAGSKAWANDLASLIHIVPEPEPLEADQPKSSKVLHNKNQAGLCLPPFRILLPDGGNVVAEWPQSWIEEKLKEQYKIAIRSGQTGAELDAHMVSMFGGSTTRFRDLRSKLNLSMRVKC